MPLHKTQKGWMWGSKGPFPTKAKALQVARAAYAHGYKECLTPHLIANVQCLDAETLSPSSDQPALIMVDEIQKNKQKEHTTTYTKQPHGETSGIHT